MNFFNYWEPNGGLVFLLTQSNLSKLSKLLNTFNKILSKLLNTFNKILNLTKISFVNFIKFERKMSLKFWDLICNLIFMEYQPFDFSHLDRKSFFSHLDWKSFFWLQFSINLSTFETETTYWKLKQVFKNLKLAKNKILHRNKKL